jgi:hypothetical protein
MLECAWQAHGAPASVKGRQDVKARRTFVGLVAAVCVAGATLGVTAHEQDSGAQQVGTSSTVVERSATSVGIEGCSTDCGLADEPTATRTAAVIIPPVTSVPQGLTPCDTPVDDLADADGQSWLSDQLVARCDYRVTGAACLEDEVCAVREIRDTGNFGGER